MAALKDEPAAIPQADAAQDAAAALRWTEDFWNEEDQAGAEMIRAGLLIEGVINTLEGHYENGKTAVMIDVARQWIEMGRPVLYLDYEMGKRRVRKRMKANNWTPEHLKLWHYLYMPNPELGLLEKLLAVLPGEHPMVAIDSVSAAMQKLGREENSATDVGNWWVNELQAARDNRGATVLVVDQVTKGATSRDRYAGRGSGAKAFGGDVIWFVERFEKFSPTQIGLVKLTLHKDREGVLPEHLAFRVGDGDGHLILAPAEPPKGDPIDADLLDDLETALRESGWQTVESLKQKVGRGYPAISSALQYLTNRGRAESRPRAGKGGGTEYGLVTEAERAVDTPSLD